MYLFIINYTLNCLFSYNEHVLHKFTHLLFLNYYSIIHRRIHTRRINMSYQFIFTIKNNLILQNIKKKNKLKFF